MQTLKASLLKAWPYQSDKMNLPVPDLEAALPFYEQVMGFRILSRNEVPHRSAILSRDGLEIGLAENGGDPTQDGCFFEVDQIHSMVEELRANGLIKERYELSTQRHGETSWDVFFVVAPDGLCYCFGQRRQ